MRRFTALVRIFVGLVLPGAVALFYMLFLGMLALTPQPRFGADETTVLMCLGVYAIMCPIAYVFEFRWFKKRFIKTHPATRNA